MKYLQKFSADFLLPDSFVFRQVRSERAYKKATALDNKTDQKNAKELSDADAENNIKAARTAEISAYKNIETHKGTLVPILKKYRENQGELALALMNKNNMPKASERRTTRQNYRKDRDLFKSSEQEFQTALDNFKAGFDPEYKRMKEGLQTSMGTLEGLKQELKEKQTRANLIGEIQGKYKKRFSKRNKESFTTGENSWQEGRLQMLEQQTQLEVSIKNAERVVREWQKIVSNFKEIDDLLKSQKDGYQRDVFKPTTKTIKERTKLLGLLKSNKALTLPGQAEGFAKRNYEVAALVKEDVLNMEEELGITRKRNELKAVQREIIDHKKDPYHNETWQKKLEELEDKESNLQGELSDMFSSSGDKAQNLVDKASDDLYTKTDAFETAQEKALEKIKTLIEEKENELNESATRGIQTSVFEKQNLETLYKQRENIEQSANLDDLPEDDEFKTFKEAAEARINAESYLTALQNELSQEGVEFSAVSIEGISATSYKSKSLDKATLSRAERLAEKEIEKALKTNFDNLDNLEKQYNQKQVQITALEEKYKLLSVDTKACKDDPSILEGINSELKAAYKEKAEIAKNIKTEIDTIQETQKKLVLEKNMAVIEARAEKKILDADPKAKESEKRKASKKLSEAEASLRAIENSLDEQVEEAITNLPQNKEKGRFGYCIEQAVNELKANGNYDRIKEINRRLNTIAFDIKDAENTQERKKFIKEKAQITKEKISLRKGFLEAKKNILKDLRRQKNELEKAYQTALDADEANTDLGKLNIKIAKKDLDEMTARIAAVSDGLDSVENDLFGNVTSKPNYKPNANCECNVYSSPENFAAAGGYKKSAEKSKNVTSKSYERINYRPKSYKHCQVSQEEFNMFPRNAQKVIFENLHMMTPVNPEKVGLSGYDQVVEIIPVNLDAVPPVEYSPRYYRVNAEGNFEWISEKKPKHGEAFDFHREYTPTTMAEKIRSLPTYFENQKDYTEASNYFVELKESYSDNENWGVVKEISTSPKHRMKLSPSNDPEDELYNESVVMEYDAINKKWKLDKSGLSEVELDELEDYGLDVDKEYSRGEFTDLIHDWSKRDRIKQKDEEISFGVKLGNWWDQYDITSPSTWFNWGEEKENA